MNLNEAVTLNGKMHFCETGNALAMRFLAASRDAVILAGASIPQDIVWRVEEALASMLMHRAKCQACEAA